MKGLRIGTCRQRRSSDFPSATRLGFHPSRRKSLGAMTKVTEEPSAGKTQRFVSGKLPGTGVGEQAPQCLPAVAPGTRVPE
jgi:hypothetical protein